MVAPLEHARATQQPVRAAEVDTVQQLLEYPRPYVESHYDEQSGMLLETRSSGLINVRDTAIAALIMAEWGQHDRAARAFGGVLNTQVLASGNAQYGNFPYFAGYPAQDLNWSAFVGSFLLVYQDRHGASIPAALKERLRTGIRAAATHRLETTVTPHATNIALLDAFVLIRAGEVLGESKFTNEGLARWQQVVKTIKTGGISEFNSPSYVMVQLYSLGFVTDYVQNSRAVNEAKQLRQMFWTSLSNHYHPPTSQIAGPFSRIGYTNTDRMRYEQTLAQLLLFRESGGKLPLTYPSYPYPGPEENADFPLHAVLPALIRQSWPANLVQSALSDVTQPREFRERTRFYTGVDSKSFQQITTYLTPRLALGSVNRAALSTEPRELIAHAVDPTGTDVGVFRMIGATAYALSRADVMVLQQKTSALVVVTADTFFGSSFPADQRTLTMQLEWFGAPAGEAGASNAPRFTGSARPRLNGAFDVEWMGIPVAVRMGDTQLRPAGGSVLTYNDATPGQPLRVALKGVPPETPAGGVNTKPSIALVYGIYFGDSRRVSADALAPVAVKVGAGKKPIQVSWKSPDGKLTMTFPNAPRRWQVNQKVGRKVIKPRALPGSSR